MKSLSETWFTEGYIDFELKKYTLLAYLQHVSAYFNQNKLYPGLADIIFHYNNIIAFRGNRKFLAEQFPRQLSDLNLKKLQVEYEKIIEDDEMMRELEEIVQYSAEQIKSTIKEGAEIYEFVETKINIEPVGLIPLDVNEGYLLIANGNASNTIAYQYQFTIYERHYEEFRGLKTLFIQEWTRSFTNTISNIKSELIRNRRELPNPAVYIIQTPLAYPMEETLLPIAKRCFVKYMSASA